MDIKFPTSSEQTHAIGTFLSSEGKEVYFEVPAVFNDGVLNQSATQDRINKFVEYANKIIDSSIIGNTSGTQG